MNDVLNLIDKNFTWINSSFYISITYILINADLNGLPFPLNEKM